MPQYYNFKSSGFNIGLIIRKIGEIRTSEAGKIRFSNLHPGYWRSALESAICFSGDRDSHVFKETINRTLLDHELPSDFTPAQFSKLCRTKHSEYLRAPTATYKSIFRIVKLDAFPRQRIELSGVKLYFCPSEESNFFKIAKKVQNDLLNAIKPPTITLPKTNSIFVCASVEARSALDAHRLASDAFDEVRGILNLAINWTKFARQSFSVRRRAVNDLLPGPVSTVHTSDGELVDRS